MSVSSSQHTSFPDLVLNKPPRPHKEEGWGGTATLKDRERESHKYIGFATKVIIKCGADPTIYLRYTMSTSKNV